MTPRKIDRSMMVALTDGQQLHVRRISDRLYGTPVLLLHGLFEDGTIFYSRTGSGLAHRLAAEGYDVFVPDLRGKGRSWPTMSRRSKYQLVDVVTQDIPAILRAIVELKGVPPVYWVTHAWGGVVASCFLARYPSCRRSIFGLINFGSHRVIGQRDWVRFFWVDLLWRSMGRVVAKIKGYIPGRPLQLGAADEYPELHRVCSDWYSGRPWVDPFDGFDYGSGLTQGDQYPPALYLASKADLAFCNPVDVGAFMREVGQHDGRMLLLAPDMASSHLAMLIQTEAVREHFPFMLDWMAEMKQLRDQDGARSHSGDDIELKSAQKVEQFID